jgi:predicted lipoprotein
MSVAHAEADHAAIARASLTEVIRPGYAAFAQATGALKQKVESLCAQPSGPALQEAKDAFAAAVLAWSKVEIVRFGPVTQDHRFERLFFWPDPKGLGLRQIQDALAKEDANVTEPDELAAKSVALQGLPALEYLLYGDGGVPDDDRDFRCKFALAVATNVDRIANSVVEAWRDGSAYEKAFMGPAPDDPYYHAPKEVTLDLFKTFTTGIELVRDQKLGKPLGANPDEAKPKLAAFWRSGLTFKNAAGNLEGARILFAQGGFAQVVRQESAGVEDSILFDLDHAIDVLRGIDQPMAEVVKDEGLRAKIEALRVALKAAAQTAGDMISRGAGLAFGFNAMDGD